MCGILFYCGEPELGELMLRFNKINYRGPDHSETYVLAQGGAAIGFHRLAINDTSSVGHQPFELDDFVMVCNGEIFNHREIEQRHQFVMRSWSDCEVILHLFKMYLEDGRKPLDALRGVVSEINGEFAFVIFDRKNLDVFFARDPFGIRPLFLGTTFDSFYSSSESDLPLFCNLKELCFASESKAIRARPCSQVAPGTCGMFSVAKNISGPEALRGSSYADVYTNMYTDYNYVSCDISEPMGELMDRLRDAVFQRVATADREIGCFLSGGVDSFIITYFVVEAFRRLGRDPSKIKVFTVGFKGLDSADVAAAREIAAALGVEHHVYQPTVEHGLRALSRTIYHLESWDTTTVRASVPQYLLSKYISENTNVRVLLSGEGSDELLGGYLYFNRAPNAAAFVQERDLLLRQLCYFDVLRTDRTTAANGLEVRVPFLDREFVSCVDGIARNKPEWLMTTSEDDRKASMTKRFLREAFQMRVVSDAVSKNCWSDEQLKVFHKYIWRTKDAFSDAVGHSWVDSLKEYASKILERLPKYKEVDEELKPQSDEAEAYRRIFVSYFGDDHVKTIPRYWMPAWQPRELVDPSARFLR